MTRTKTRALANWPNNAVSVLDFGAVGDGVTDDTAAIQAALDTCTPVLVPPGKFRITSSLIIDPSRNRGAGLLGTASPSRYNTTVQPGGQSPWDGRQEATIFYDGPSSSTSCVIRVSASDVGVQVDQTFSNTIYGLQIKNIVVNGNNKAAYGLYVIRASEPQVSNVVSMGTNSHAFYIDQAYSGEFNNIRAEVNNGCGISVGRGGLDFGWTAGKFVNAVVFTDLHASANGGDKAFNETTNPAWGYGIGLWLHRGNFVNSFCSEVNDGVGIYLAPSDQNNYIASGYTELNSKYVVNGTDAIADGRSTRKWALWFEGSVGGLASKVANCFFAGEAIRITGTEPSSGRKESGFELNNITGGSYLEADWGNYRIFNCSRDYWANVVGIKPGAPVVNPSGIQFNPDDDYVNPLRTGVLDIYEAGAFAPSFAGATTAGSDWGFSVQQGSFTRVGQLVSVNGRINVSAKATDAAGSLLITNLPFPIGTSNHYWTTGSIYLSNTTTLCINTVVSGKIGTTTFGVDVVRTNNLDVQNALTVNDVEDNTICIFQLTYMTDDRTGISTVTVDQKRYLSELE